MVEPGSLTEKTETVSVLRNQGVLHMYTLCTVSPKLRLTSRMSLLNVARKKWMPRNHIQCPQNPCTEPAAHPRNSNRGQLSRRAMTARNENSVLRLTTHAVRHGKVFRGEQFRAR